MELIIGVFEFINRESVGSICSSDIDPQSCYDAIKNECNDAKAALDNALAGYKKARYDSDQYAPIMFLFNLHLVGKRGPVI
jgi:hypothetical protein